MKYLQFIPPDLLLILQILYFALLIFVCLRVIIDTRAVSKTLAYLLLVIFVPVLGMAFYFSFGVNYRKRKVFRLKHVVDQIHKNIFVAKYDEFKSDRLLSSSYFNDYLPLINLIENRNLGEDLVLPNDELLVLQNGENKFPVLLEALRQAKHHIHMEYYIYNDDEIGRTIRDILIAKAKEGVIVRFIYDDFGSLGIRKDFVKSMIAQGVHCYPFNRLILVRLANRLNYRNHRKIVVIDGYTSFVGGINVSDKYINSPEKPLYWRDTHLMLKGSSTLALQRLFLADWKFCSQELVTASEAYFPQTTNTHFSKFVQVVSSGPDYAMPNILYAILQAINVAKTEILITTPYYIPDNTLQEALKVAAMGGKKVKLLIPEKGDSYIVSVCTASFLQDLLTAGVEVYQYKKGFVHAKTFVIDGKIASIGTANMDLRSFDLNFEVMTLLYDEEIAQSMQATFYKDLEDAQRMTLRVWRKRPKTTKLVEKIIRLLSPFL